jgi:hypothetical protein
MADPQEKGPWDDYAKPAQESGPWEDYAQPARPDFAQNPPSVPRPEPTELRPGGTMTAYGPMSHTQAAQAGPYTPAGQYESSTGFGAPIKNQMKSAAHMAAMGANVAAPIMTAGASLPIQSAIQGGLGALQTATEGGTPGQIATSGAIGAAIPPIAEGTAFLGGKLLKALRPIEPNAAITEGLHVPEKSKLMQQTVRDVESARPYLGGKTPEGGLPSQADIQARIPGAKQEIYSPINKALDLVKDNPVEFGGEKTSVGRLQEMRNQLSAQRSKLIKGLSPEQVSELRATGGKVADLYDQIDKIDATLDPEIAKTGIDPAKIRRQYGAVKGVERRISGKLTTTEPEQAYGLRKLVPFKAPGALGIPEWQWKPIEGVRDIRSGQAFSGKPSDVGIGRVFRESGAKPDLGTPVNPRITAPSRMLPPGPRMMGSSMEPIGESSGVPELLPYQPSLQQPPAFVRPMEIRPAPGTQTILPPEGGLFDLNVPRQSSAPPRAGNLPPQYERAMSPSQEPVRIEYDSSGNVTGADGRHRVIAALKRGDESIQVQTRLANGKTETLNVSPRAAARVMGVDEESLRATDEQQAQYRSKTKK